MANVIAIVGRTNVGKSTLFNRLIEERKAIMYNESNTTRDRHYGYAEWIGKHFTVIDTGGYMQTGENMLEEATREQVQIAIEEASVLFFVVDCKDGLVALDTDFANLLRATKKPVFVVANKADTVQYELMASEFYALGMGKPYPTSAVSGMGTGELLDEVVKYFKDELRPYDSEIVPRLTLLGRPNVGKSSFLNVLMGEMRSIVTPFAGTTRDAIDTHYKLYNKHFVLTDTAGIRKKSQVKNAIEFYSVIRAIRALQDSDVCLIMIDAQQGLEAQDIQLIALAHRYKKGLVLLVNKWDLIEKDSHTLEDYKKQLMHKLTPLDYIPIVFISTIKKQRVYQCIENALQVYKNRKQKIATSQLNSVMLAAIARYAPPAVKGKYIKIKYVTQLPTELLNFAFFCNFPQYIQPSYKRYLENQLRSNFSLQGVPIQLIFRKK